MNKFLLACIAYYGGKRKLVKRIINLAKKICPQIDTFVDCFFGGGSVSVAAKLQNWRVLTNDWAYRSYSVAMSLIYNHNEKINEYDLLKIYNNPLFEKAKDINPQLYDEVFKYVPIKQHCDFIIATGYLNNVEQLFKNKIKHFMINHLLIKYITRMCHFSNFQTFITYNALVKNKDYKGTTLKQFQNVLQPSIVISQKIANIINNALFNNGKENLVYNIEVKEFINIIKDKINPETTVFYLDPPYLGAIPYEHNYKLIDEVLFHPMNLTSKLNQKNEYENFFCELLTNINSFYIISYAGDYVDNIINIVKKVKTNVNYEEIDYLWYIGNKPSGIPKVKEYLIYGS